MSAENGDMKQIPVLNETQVIEKLLAKRKDNPPSSTYHCMYSSYLDAIVKEPSLMVVPLDDHMVHRGHAVFDTATVCGGRVYRLNIHVDRFFKSAEAARITHPWSKEEVKRIVLETVSASGKRDANVRMWLSAGWGNFSISPEATNPSLYVIALGTGVDTHAPPGIHEISVPETEVPIKPQLLANLKSNNYMINAHTHMYAKDRGGYWGVGVDKDGYLTESCVCCVAIVTKEGVFKTPKFDKILCGTTIRRALEFARKAVAEKHTYTHPPTHAHTPLLTDVQQCDIHIEEAYAAQEIILFSGDVHVDPIVSLDQKQIGDGVSGPVHAYMFRSIIDDALYGTDDHAPVVYA
eukprot:GDKI01022644.1.p1 GENE.GDKI01022644.1~~GDKI01022644.1.p1  ORF type:complete len:350 (-),score=110.90 GDKI01022644.1:194-1243(-)